MPIPLDDLYDLDAEKGLLAIMLVEPVTYANIGSSVRGDDFYDARNRCIYEAISHVAMSGGEPNIATLLGELERTSKLGLAGGQAHLSDIVDSYVSYTYLDHYATRVRDLSHRRALIATAQRIAATAHDPSHDANSAQEVAEMAVLEAAQRIMATRDPELMEVARQANARIEAYARGQGNVDAIPTGLKGLDDLLGGGIEPGLFVIAGRPSMGKTSIMLQIADGMLFADKRILLFTLEMSGEQLLQRMATTKAGVSLQELKGGPIDGARLGRVFDMLGRLAETKFDIIDRPAITPASVLSVAQHMRMRYQNLDAIMIDGLWLMEAERAYENRVRELTTITGALKRIQRVLDIPVIVTHQLSRASELRTDRRPILSDLRDSGSVEMDADVVIMLHRSGYYDPYAEEANVMELWIRKNRLGGPANECIKMAWVGHLMRLERLAYYENERRTIDDDR